MATKTFPGSTSGVTFSPANTFDFAGDTWTPADGYVGSGTEVEGSPSHAGNIFIVPDFPFDLSTLGATAGNITQAIVTYDIAGAYSTAGPGTNYSFSVFDVTHTQADGASWADASSSWDATLFFTDGMTYFTDMADLPTFIWTAFAGGGTIENGVSLTFTISVLSIEFTYTPSATPVVTDVDPTHGDATGGTVVTLTGTDLDLGTNAFFNGTAATSYNASSSTSATCIAPEHAVGQVTVTVA